MPEFIKVHSHTQKQTVAAVYLSPFKQGSTGFKYNREQSSLLPRPEVAASLLSRRSKTESISLKEFKKESGEWIVISC